MCHILPGLSDDNELEFSDPHGKIPRAPGDARIHRPRMIIANCKPMGDFCNVQIFAVAQTRVFFPYDVYLC
jgi:hypothetical protein